jgi:hypothetical protein
VFFDNVNKKVESGDLAALITSNEYQARELGGSRLIHIKTRAALAFAGNNMEFSEELLRRIVPIRIDAACENPAARTEFRYDFHAFLRDHRADLHWACCVLIRWWVQNGCPPGTKSLGSFETWSRVMGGILAVAEVPGFLENLPSYRNANADAQASDQAFVEALWKKYRDKPFSSRDAYDDLQTALHGWPYEHMELDTQNEDKAVKRLGQYMRSKVAVGTYTVEGMKMVVAKGPMKDGTNQWRLTSV